MAQSLAERRYSADDLADLPYDTNRSEVIDGVLCVTPARFARVLDRRNDTVRALRRSPR